MRKEYRWRRIVQLLVVLLVLLVLFWAAYVALQVVTVGAHDERRTADAIVVLGAGEYLGRPSVPFVARLDHALSLYEEGLASLIIVSGGDRDGNSYMASDLGARYLEQHGLPPDALLTVGGDSTYENLREAKALAEWEGLGTVLLVSERYHMFRSLTIAADLGMQAYGSPTTISTSEQTPAGRLYYSLYSSLREVAAYSAYFWLGIENPPAWELGNKFEPNW